MILLVAERAWVYAKEGRGGKQVGVDTNTKMSIIEKKTSVPAKAVNSEITEDENKKEYLMQEPCPSKPVVTAETIGRIGK